MLFWPATALLSIGLMGDFLHLEEKALSFVVTGAIAQGVLQVCQLDVAYGLMYDVWSKSVKHTFLAPIRLWQFMLGPWMIGMMRSGILFTILVFLGNLAFGFHLKSLSQALVFLSGMYLSALLIGMAVCSLIFTFGNRAEITAWALSVLVMLLSGLYYPVSLLPGPVFVAAQMIPLSYFLDAVRAAYGFEPLFSHGFLKGVCLSALYIPIMLYVCERTLHRARRAGTLLRLSE